MRSQTASLAGVISITFFATVGAHGKQADAKSDVTVCLHNAIVATPGAVERARLVTKSMFASVGVNIIWGACDSEPQEGLTVNVILESRDTGDDDSGPLAEAYPFAGSTGHIVIRYDRVHSSAGVSRELEPVLLAHVLVHEMTHVLQCLDRHADSGVMKAHWTSEDYFEMRWKPLPFTREDVDLLHLGMEVLRARPQNRPEGGHREPIQSHSAAPVPSS